MRKCAAVGFIGSLLVATAAIAAEAENGPAGWLQCDPVANPKKCWNGPTDKMYYWRILPAINKGILINVNNPACPDGMTEVSQAMTDSMRNGNYTPGIKEANQANRSTCAVVCAVANNLGPDDKYAYVRGCVSESGTTNHHIWCEWSNKSSLGIPAIGISQLTVQLSPDGSRFAACAISNNWSDDRKRSFKMQILMSPSILPHPGQPASPVWRLKPPPAVQEMH